MDKHEHGLRLKAAMASKRLDRTAIADLTGVKPRTVTNWTSGSTMPTLAEREAMRDVLGDYDAEGDPVEVAIENSPLDGWRKRAVISDYQRHLHEQEREAAG